MADIKRLPRLEFPADVRIDTLAVREGLPRTQWGENSEALFLTSSFVHPDAATAAARFANEEEAFVYSRFSNPSVTMFERRLAALEGAECALATSSGMAAILLLIMGLLKAGDHVVCSRSVFGSTIKLLQGELGKFGVESTFVSQTDVAEWLQAQASVTRVYYPGLASHPQHELAMAQQGGCGGAVVSFVVRGDTPEEARRNAFAVIDATRICSISANLGDTKTIITHPASTSHGRLSEEQRLAAGITQGLIRVATGLEHVDDIKNDLNTGLTALAASK